MWLRYLSGNDIMETALEKTWKRQKALVCEMLTCNCPAGEAGQAAKSHLAAWDLATTRTAVASQINAATGYRGMAAYTVEASHSGKLAIAASAVLVHTPCNVVMHSSYFRQKWCINKLQECGSIHR